MNGARMANEKGSSVCLCPRRCRIPVNITGFSLPYPCGSLCRVLNIGAKAALTPGMSMILQAMQVPYIVAASFELDGSRQMVAAILTLHSLCRDSHFASDLDPRPDGCPRVTGYSPRFLWVSE